MQGAASSYVYRVNANGVVENVSVQAGLTTKDGGWIIDSGLDAGDKVVVSGVMKLRPGMQVEPIVVNSKAPAAEKAVVE